MCSLEVLWKIICGVYYRVSSSKTWDAAAAPMSPILGRSFYFLWCTTELINFGKKLLLLLLFGEVKAQCRSRYIGRVLVSSMNRGPFARRILR